MDDDWGYPYGLETSISIFHPRWFRSVERHGLRWWKASKKAMICWGASLSVIIGSLWIEFIEEIPKAMWTFHPVWRKKWFHPWNAKTTIPGCFHRKARLLLKDSEGRNAQSFWVHTLPILPSSVIFCSSMFSSSSVPKAIFVWPKYAKFLLSKLLHVQIQTRACQVFCICILFCREVHFEGPNSRWLQHAFWIKQSRQREWMWEWSQACARSRKKFPRYRVKGVELHWRSWNIFGNGLGREEMGYNFKV